MIIRPMTIDDYDEVFAMWQITTKRALSKADEKSQIERYLRRNEGMSQVQTRLYPPHGGYARVPPPSYRAQACRKGD